jgi:hypothetical protein
MKPLLMCALLLSVASATAAEPPQASAGAPPSIKALTPDHVAGLLAGAGLGYAKAAELNRYPGPLHVLELADELGLDAAQREATRALRTRVVEQASALGAELVAAEAELDAMFRSASVSQPAMDEALVRIGTLQSRLRGVHLGAHIEQRALLSPEQVDRYVRLRGYADPGGHAHGAGHAH